jgi:hypothetical protein
MFFVQITLYEVINCVVFLLVAVHRTRKNAKCSIPSIADFAVRQTLNLKFQQIECYKLRAL